MTSTYAKITLTIFVLSTFTLGSHVRAAGNPVKGEQIFQQCAACHAVGDGAMNTVGPNLNHLFGRKAGSIDDFAYSAAMSAKGESDGLIWEEQSIYIFLAGPARYVPGTIMAFEGLATEQEIKDLLAWLIQYSPAYEPNSGKIVPANVAKDTKLPEAKASALEEENPDFSETYLASAEAIGTGGELWGKQCRHCHGNSAYPGKAPKLKPASYSADFVFSRLTDGFRKMPAWKSVFTLEQRMAITAYVLSREFSP